VASTPGWDGWSEITSGSPKSEMVMHRQACLGQLCGVHTAVGVKKKEKKEGTSCSQTGWVDCRCLQVSRVQSLGALGADHRIAAKTRPAAPRPALFSAAAYAAPAELDEDCEDEDEVSGTTREDDDETAEKLCGDEVVEILEEWVL